MVDFPFETPALLVKQPLGTFYVAVLPAELLLQVAASDVMSARINDDGVGYSLSGTQRLIQDRRLTAIADYIDRIDAAFPNSIILAANYNQEIGIDQDETEDIEEEGRTEEGGAEAGEPAASKAWTVSQGRGGVYRLTIPTGDKLASIIDGQHRLFAFTKADPRTRLDMQLICAIFLDLPKPFQAQLFATINSSQKAVDRSLTYELFGYNIDDEPESRWTPDKLAVFLARKLGTEATSPLKGKIIVAPKRDEALQTLAGQTEWKVSTAVVVDGILRLISANPKRDANAMRTPESRPRAVLQAGPKDRSPLREAFISGNDTLIYTMVTNYVMACEKLFWKTAQAGSYITKTVGVQALFDILRKLAPASIQGKDLRITYFERKLRRAAEIDFSADNFRIPAGSGRTAIRRAIEAKLAE